MQLSNILEGINEVITVQQPIEVLSQYHEDMHICVDGYEGVLLVQV